jgi:flagellar biosynthesis/type III secretory pathway M-ring protein FliF/YscJ
MAETGVKYTKPFDKDEEDSASVGEMNFSPNNRSKTVKILAVVVIILVILVIIFLALFASERNRSHDCKGRRGAHG